MRNDLIGKRIEDVLGDRQGWIELQDIMGDDLAIVNAARTSYLGESKGDEADKKLLNYLMKHRHTTPFEMVEFKFRLHAPLMVIQQWLRHRTYNFNQQSGRYVPFERNDFYLPQVWRKQSKSNKQASDGEFSSYQSRELTLALIRHVDEGYKLYQQALDIGVAKEQARLFLNGFAVCYTLVAKIDAHNLLHFLKLRMDEGAQWEIRQYANVIWSEFFKEALPWTAEAAEKYLLTGIDK